MDGYIYFTHQCTILVKLPIPQRRVIDPIFISRSFSKLFIFCSNSTFLDWLLIRNRAKNLKDPKILSFFDRFFLMQIIFWIVCSPEAEKTYQHTRLSRSSWHPSQRKEKCGSFPTSLLPSFVFYESLSSSPPSQSSRIGSRARLHDESRVHGAEEEYLAVQINEIESKSVPESNQVHPHHPVVICSPCSHLFSYGAAVITRRCWF